MLLQRYLEQNILERFFRGKAIIILGPRQVGKTTLLQMIREKSEFPSLYLNADETDIRGMLSNTTSTALRAIIGKNRLVIIDEAQRVKDIGITLKLIVDNFPDVQLLVSGSSSLEIASRTSEPLTGRKYEYQLYPLSFHEMLQNSSLLEEKRLLERRLIYGYYPEIVTHPGEEEELLNLLAGSYLFKDLFTLEQIKRHSLLEKLVQALALQLGNEVSYRELGQLVGADNQTVERYIDLLEQAFIIFRLTAFSRNLRNEIKKSRKIYFYDNGIRNAVIKNFNPPALRQDIGSLWENFLISERMKANQFAGRWVNRWFWRTPTQQEIDYIEEHKGKLFAFEFKWNPTKKVRFPRSFLKAYPDSETQSISRNNFQEFIMPGNG